MTNDDRRSRPLLVGRDPAKPPRRSELYVPFVGSQSGRRIARLCGLDSDEELRDHFEMRNLFGYTIPGPIEDWDEARRRAFRITELIAPDRHVILFGGDVARAFGVGNADLFKWTTKASALGLFNVAVCPHPSGRSRFWNEPENVELAEEFFDNLMRRYR